MAPTTPPPSAPPPPPAPQPPPAPDAVAAFQGSFYTFATAMCAGCHSEKPNEGVLVPQNPLFASSNVTYAYVAAKPFADFGSPASSLLVAYAGNNHCGLPARCGSASAAALAQLTTWLASDTPLPAVPARAAVSDLEALQLVAADLQAQPAAVQPYLRYFTLEYWGNTGGRPPLVSVFTERAALIKMLNLLSTKRQLVQPTAIDADGLVYRVDTRSLGWTAGAWTNLKATDPYFRPADLPASLAAAAAQSARADWFVYSIPNSAVDAYFAFLGIDSDDPTIDALNNVDRFADMTTGYPATMRAGFSVSRTEAFNRIISWHQTTALGSGAIGSGHLFKSYNMDADVGAANIYAHPYRPTTNMPSTMTAGPYDFAFGDSDSIFTLPNGLFGYYTTEPATGAVESLASAGAAFPGPTFCFQCHDNQTNMIPFVDEMHDAIAAAPAGTFPSTLQPMLLAMYDQPALDAKMTAAGATFGAAYAQLALPALDIAGTPTGLGTEVMNVVTNNYSIVLQLDTAAGELGVTTAQLVAAIKSSPVLASTMASLLTEHPVVRRDTWEASYATVRKLLFPQL
ncbi:MAG: hypothetical protein ACM31C_20495 [Acidobacteriota bacterium]